MSGGVHMGVEDHAMGRVHSQRMKAQGAPPVGVEST